MNSNRTLLNCKLNDRAKELQYLLNITLLLIFYTATRFCLQYFFYDIFPQYTDWEAYREGSILLHTIEKNKFFTFILISGAIPYLTAAWDNAWSTFTNNYVRITITTALLLLAVQWGLMDYNYYLNQGFAIERILLLVFAIFTYIHPGFTVGFALVFLPYMSQYEVPSSFISFDYYMFKETLFLFLGFLLLRTLSKEKIDSTFNWSMLCIWGSYILSFGLNRLLIGNNLLSWVRNYDLKLLLIRMNFLGWTEQLPDPVLTILHFGSTTLSDFVLLLTVIIQLSAIFILFHRKLTIFIFYSQALMFLIYFFSTGVFFWGYIIFFTFFSFYYLVLQTSESEIPLRKSFLLRLLSVVLILFLGSRLHATEDYQRWESKYLKRYTLIANKGSDKDRLLSFATYQPFLRHLGFSLNRLDVYAKGPQVDSPPSSYKIYKYLDSRADSIRNIRSVRVKGTRLRNKQRREYYSDFFNKFSQRKLQRQRKRNLTERFLQYFPTFHLINTFNNQGKNLQNRHKTNIKSISLFRSEALYQEAQIVTFDSQLLKKFPLQ